MLFLCACLFICSYFYHNLVIPVACTSISAYGVCQPCRHGNVVPYCSGSKSFCLDAYKCKDIIFPLLHKNWIHVISCVIWTDIGTFVFIPAELQNTLIPTLGQTATSSKTHTLTDPICVSVNGAVEYPDLNFEVKPLFGIGLFGCCFTVLHNNPALLQNGADGRRNLIPFLL